MAAYFPAWQLKTGGIIAPDERLPSAQMFAMGAQHVVAMFGATVLAPLLMGFDPNVAILMSGVGTLVFFVVTAGRVPSYLGSSFAFIGVVIAATGYGGTGENPRISLALGGIVVCGIVYAAVGAVVMAIGTRWIEKWMPPVVTGAIVAVIGLNLAPIAVKGATASSFDAWMALATVLLVGGVAVYTRGTLQRLLILVGLALAYALYVILTGGFGRERVAQGLTTMRNVLLAVAAACPFGNGPKSVIVRVHKADTAEFGGVAEMRKFISNFVPDPGLA